MNAFYCLLFLVIFTYNAVTNPFWGLIAYPIIGFLIWILANAVRSRSMSAMRALGWFPILLWSVVKEPSKL